MKKEYKVNWDKVFLYIVIVLMFTIQIALHFQYTDKLNLLNEDLETCMNSYFNCEFERVDCIENPTCEGLDYTTDCRYQFLFEYETYNSYLERDFICNEESGEYLYYFQKDYWCNELNRCGVYPEGF